MSNFMVKQVQKHVFQCIRFLAHDSSFAPASCHPGCPSVLVPFGCAKPYCPCQSHSVAASQLQLELLQAGLRAAKGNMSQLTNNLAVRNGCFQ